MKALIPNLLLLLLSECVHATPSFQDLTAQRPETGEGSLCIFESVRKGYRTYEFEGICQPVGSCGDNNFDLSFRTQRCSSDGSLECCFMIPNGEIQCFYNYVKNNCKNVRNCKSTAQQNYFVAPFVNSCPGEPHIGCCVQGDPPGGIMTENPDYLIPSDESSSLFSDITIDQSLFPLNAGGNVLGMGSSSSPSSFFSAPLTLPNDATSPEILFGGNEGLSVPDYTAFLQDGSWGGTEENGQGEFALGDGIGAGLGNEGLFSDQLAALGDGEMFFRA